LRGEVGWERVAAVASPDDFSPHYRPIVEALSTEGDPLDLSLLMQHLDEESTRRVSYLTLVPLRFTDVEKALQDALAKLVRLPAIEKRLVALRQEIKESEERGDRDRLDRLQRAYSVLVAERLSRRIDGARETKEKAKSNIQ
jgi:replicative DNA helicase